MCYPLSDRDDDLRACLNHRLGKIWKLIEPALTRVALDDQIAPFVISELSQLFEKHAEERMINLGDLCDRCCAHDECYSMRLHRHLSPSREAGDRGCRRTPDEGGDVPSSNSITSSARARRLGAIVRPRAFAVL